MAEFWVNITGAGLIDSNSQWDLLVSRDIGATGVRWSPPIYATFSSPGIYPSQSLLSEITTIIASGFKLGLLLDIDVDNRAGGWDSIGGVDWYGWVPKGVEWRAVRVPPYNDVILNHIGNFYVHLINHAVSGYQAIGKDPTQYLEIELANEPRLVTYAYTTPGSTLTTNGSTTTVINVQDTTSFAVNDIIRIKTPTRQWGKIQSKTSNTITLTAALTDPQYGPSTAPASGITVNKCDNYQNSPYSVDDGFWYSVNYLLSRIKTAHPAIRVWAPALFNGSSGAGYAALLVYASHLEAACSVSGYTNLSQFDGFALNLYYTEGSTQAEFSPKQWGRNYAQYVYSVILALRNLTGSMGFNRKPFAITEWGVTRSDLQQGTCARQSSETNRGRALTEATQMLRGLPVHRISLFSARDGGNYTISSSQYGLISILGRASIALSMLSRRTNNPLINYPSWYAVSSSGWFFSQDLFTGYQYEDNTLNTNASTPAGSGSGGGLNPPIGS